jgi:hypothetical protein
MAGFMADDVGGQESAAGVGPVGRGDAARAVTDLSATITSNLSGWPW